MPMDYVVEMRGITKDFPGIRANDAVSISLGQGEILAILGENGAGKSTLMSILFGLYQPDTGTILVDGREVRITDPNVANDLGIGMVHQHFKLVQDFTVCQNIILGREPRKGPAMDMKAARQKVSGLSRLYGLNVEPDARIEDISVGMQQRVEILKMLYRDARILVFDEPTAVLTPQEVLELMEIMRRLRQEGKSIILITHKLKEIKAIADRCVVIRRGKVVADQPVDAASEAELARLMVGREVSFTVDKPACTPGETILEVQGLRVRDQRKVRVLEDAAFTLRQGEILGIAGVDGNGQRELVEALWGLCSLEAGTIRFKGQDISRWSIRRRILSGMAHIPEDRQSRGLVLDYTLKENMALMAYHQAPYSRRGWLDSRAMETHAKRLIQDYDVRCGQGALSPARGLSGGNQQKAIVAREMEANPDLLVAVQPTRGLDVGSIEYIHRRLVAQRQAGKAILLVSLELDEILDLSDRIGVMHQGRVVAVLDRKDADEFKLGRLMAGLEEGA